jgi:general stress protein 26
MPGLVEIDASRADVVTESGGLNARLTPVALVRTMDSSNRGSVDPAENPPAHVAFEKLVESFRTAMLVTRTPAGSLRARPMEIAAHEGGGRLVFVTSLDSGKVDEIAEDRHVCVTLQEGQRCVSISGNVKVRRERARIRELWREPWRAWWPNGPEDEQLVLLDLEPQQAEYWDRSGSNRLAYVFEAGRAIFSGRRVNEDRLPHGKLDLSR